SDSLEVANDLRRPGHRLRDRRSFNRNLPDVAERGFIGVSFDKQLHFDRRIPRIPSLAMSGPLQNIFKVSFQGDLEVMNLNATLGSIDDESHGHTGPDGGKQLFMGAGGRVTRI